MNYTLSQIIKETDKAKVFVAMTPDKKLVIVKELTAAQLPIFEALKELNSSYFPHIFEAFEKNGTVVVVEQFVNGATLEDYLDPECTDLVLSDVEKMDILIEICEALALLHSCNPPIIHRDIKPSNILLTSNKNVKIIDFDAARNYKPDCRDRDTVLMVTEGYAPPEQYGSEQTDGRADIFALGKVIEKMHVLEGTVYAKRVDRIKKKCCQKDPDVRYQNIDEVKKDLIKLQDWAIKKFDKKKLFIMLSVGAASVLAFIGLTVFTLHDLSERKLVATSELLSEICYIDEGDKEAEIRLKELSEKKIIGLYNEDYEMLSFSTYSIADDGKSLLIMTDSGTVPGNVRVLLNDGTLCSCEVVVR